MCHWRTAAQDCTHHSSHDTRQSAGRLPCPSRPAVPNPCLGGSLYCFCVCPHTPSVNNRSIWIFSSEAASLAGSRRFIADSCGLDDDERCGRGAVVCGLYAPPGLRPNARTPRSKRLTAATLRLLARSVPAGRGDAARVARLWIASRSLARSAAWRTAQSKSTARSLRANRSSTRTHRRRATAAGK